MGLNQNAVKEIKDDDVVFENQADHVDAIETQKMSVQGQEDGFSEIEQDPVEKIPKDVNCEVSGKSEDGDDSLKIEESIKKYLFQELTR